MNYRGNVLMKYLKNFPEKFLKKMEGRNDYIEHEHTKRIDSLFVKAFVLSQKEQIERLVSKGYRELLTPDEIVDLFIYNRSCFIRSQPIHNDMDKFCFEVDAIDLKFNPETEEFNKLPDIDLYPEDIKAELLSFIQKRFTDINSKTLVLL